MNKKRAKVVIPHDPEQIFMSANDFHAAGQRLMRDGFGTPWAVCSALALELYFKCLLALDNRVSETTDHDLLKMFYELNPNDQKIIKDSWKRMIVNRTPMPIYVNMSRPQMKDDLPVDFDSILGKSSKAFVHLRYEYEGLNKPWEGWTAEIILGCTRGLITKVHRREWAAPKRK